MCHHHIICHIYYCRYRLSVGDVHDPASRNSYANPANCYIYESVNQTHASLGTYSVHIGLMSHQHPRIYAHYFNKYERSALLGTNRLGSIMYAPVSANDVVFIYMLGEQCTCTEILHNYRLASDAMHIDNVFIYYIYV